MTLQPKSQRYCAAVCTEVAASQDDVMETHTQMHLALANGM
jgi:hypothetical protein